GHPVAAAERPTAEAFLPRAVGVRRHRGGRAQPKAVATLVGMLVGVRDEDRERAEHADHRRTRALHLGPEVRHRAPSLDGRTAEESIGSVLAPSRTDSHGYVGTASITASGASTVMQCTSAGVVLAPITSTARAAKSPCTTNTVAAASASW